MFKFTSFVVNTVVKLAIVSATNRDIDQCKSPSKTSYVGTHMQARVEDKDLYIYPSPHLRRLLPPPNVENITARIRVIHGYNCGLKTISADAFCGMEYVKELFLVKNALRIAPPIGPLRKTIRNLNLFHNQISVIPKGYFQRLHALTYLNLDNNLLLKMPDISGVAKTLSSFLINHNEISTLDGDWTSAEYVDLTFLSVTFNKLTIIKDLKFCSALETLELQHNEIQTMSYTSINWNQTNVFLESNQWTCNQSIVWMQTGVYNERFLHKQQLQCYLPPCLHGELIEQAPTHVLKHGCHHQNQKDSTDMLQHIEIIEENLH